MNRYQQNTWRVLNGLQPHPTMEEIVRKLKRYVETYDQQPGYEDYTDETLIEDVLYGLGAAIDPKYQFADGLKKFKKRIIKHIEETT